MFDLPAPFVFDFIPTCKFLFFSISIFPDSPWVLSSNCFLVLPTALHIGVRGLVLGSAYKEHEQVAEAADAPPGGLHLATGYHDGMIRA